MSRAQLSNLAVLCIWSTPLLQVFHHDTLIWHDDEKYIRRHNCGRECTEVKKCCAPCENFVVAPAHRNQEYKQQKHEHCRAFTKLRLAEEIINDPADGQRRCRNHNALQQADVCFGCINQIQLAPNPINNHKEGRTRKPSCVAFPFEPR